MVIIIFWCYVRLKHYSFEILSCLVLADVQGEVTIVAFRRIGAFKKSFSHEDFNFGDLDRFTFKVHVFDIKGFISLKVSVV